MSRITNRDLDKYFGHLEDHEYKHFNSALGIEIEGKEHFRKIMEQGKYIPYDLACKYAEEHDRKKQNKTWNISKKALNIIKSVKLTKDKNGNIKLGGRALKALRELGAIPSPEVEKQLRQIQQENTSIRGGFGKKDQGTFTKAVKR